jgi:L-lactate dehydrogenase complex protein LldG
VSSRDVVLGRIRAALSGDAGAADAPIERNYRTRAEGSREAIVDEFAGRVAEYRAMVHRVGSVDLPGAITAACERRTLTSLAVPGDLPEDWLPAGLDVLRDTPTTPLSKEQLDGSGGVLTGCALGIAQTGTIVLDGGAMQGRRVLTLLPDYHLCVVYEDQVVALVPEAFALLGDDLHRATRPITFISGPSATSDIELNRVEGVHGPRTLEVLLVRRDGEGA